MANDINNCTFTGRLTRDPQVRYTTANKAVVDFSVAVGKKYKDKEETTYVDCVAWERLAEVIGEYAKKGTQVAMVGSLQQDNWVDKESGQKRSKLRLVVDRLQLLSRKDGDGGERAEPPPQDDPPASSTDVPF